MHPVRVPPLQISEGFQVDTTSETARLRLGDEELELPIRVGTEGNRAVDVGQLYRMTGHITLDDGYANTGSTLSTICYVDGERGVLRYRGYPIEEIATRCDFTETAYLLIYGELPTVDQLEHFRANVRNHTLLHEGMRSLFTGYPPDAHPMAILSSVVGALAIYDKDSRDPLDPKQTEMAIYRMMAKMPTIAAFSYKQSIGQPFVYPQNNLTYCQNFLHMMFAVPSEQYEMEVDFVAALNLLMILHADHGQEPCTAGPTRPASPCSNGSWPTAASWTNTSTRPRTPTTPSA
jgi:citrate synthase